jgi:prepilin-type N-terminal cleavage/methylation domain-containing protein
MPQHRGVFIRRERRVKPKSGFTLLELLVVAAMIALLAALLLPALASARHAGKRAACIANLRQIGIAIHSYSDDFHHQIPYGPKAPPFTSPASFYPSTGAPTSLLSLQTGAPVGLGLLLQDSYLASQSKVLFCPGADQPVDAATELAKVGRLQAQSSYYYRHAGNTQLFDSHATAMQEIPRLDRLGSNRQGLPIRALAMDTQFLSPPDLASFNVKPRTHHRMKLANILSADGSVASRVNGDGRYTVDLRVYGDIHEAFSRILLVFERADGEF